MYHTGVCPLPFFRIDGLQMGQLFLKKGGTMVTMPRYDLKQLLEAVTEYRAHRL
jgi:acyl-CoA synthetase (AMP-forming)/AMP-acid ligase II